MDKLYTFNEKTLSYEKVKMRIIFIDAALIILYLIGTIFLFSASQTYSVKINEVKKADILIINSNDSIGLVTASCYRAEVGQTDSTPLITADGSLIDTTNIDELRWCAISRDLEKLDIKMGDRILVFGVGQDYDGVWIIKDRMNKRFKRKIDFLISKERKADLFKNVKITKI